MVINFEWSYKHPKDPKTWKIVQKVQKVKRFKNYFQSYVQYSNFRVKCNIYKSLTLNWPFLLDIFDNFQLYCGDYLLFDFGHLLDFFNWYAFILNKVQKKNLQNSLSVENLIKKKICIFDAKIQTIFQTAWQLNFQFKMDFGQKIIEKSTVSKL